MGLPANWQDNYDIAVLATMMGVPKEGPSAGHHHRHRDRLGPHGPARPQRHRHDRRDHDHGQGACHRRRPAEAPGSHRRRAARRSSCRRRTSGTRVGGVGEGLNHDAIQGAACSSRIYWKPGSSPRPAAGPTSGTRRSPCRDLLSEIRGRHSPGPDGHRCLFGRSWVPGLHLPMPGRGDHLHPPTPQPLGYPDRGVPDDSQARTSPPRHPAQGGRGDDTDAPAGVLGGGADLCPERGIAWAWLWGNLGDCLKQRARQERIDVLRNWKKVWSVPKSSIEDVGVSSASGNGPRGRRWLVMVGSLQVVVTGTWIIEFQKARSRRNLPDPAKPRQGSSLRGSGVAMASETYAHLRDHTVGDPQARRDDVHRRRDQERADLQRSSAATST